MTMWAQQSARLLSSASTRCTNAPAPALSTQHRAAAPRPRLRAHLASRYSLTDTTTLSMRRASVSRAVKSSPPPPPPPSTLLDPTCPHMWPNVSHTAGTLHMLPELREQSKPGHILRPMSQHPALQVSCRAHAPATTASVAPINGARCVAGGRQRVVEERHGAVAGALRRTT